MPDALVIVLEEIAPIAEGDYVRCEWCSECVYHDMWLNLPDRVFYRTLPDGLAVCEHCVDVVEGFA